MALANDPRSFEPFRQSLEDLLTKLNSLLTSVQQCAKVGDQINGLVDLRYREQEVVNSLVPTLNMVVNSLHPTQDQEEIDTRTKKINAWDKEIKGLTSPFPKTEREIYIFLGDLRDVLKVLPIEPPQLGNIRSEIERLEIWENARYRFLGMRPSYSDVLAVRLRLGEMLKYLSQAQEATHEDPSPLPPAAPSAPAEQSGRRERGPDIETSQKRIELEEILTRELVTIAQRIGALTTLDELKKTYPEFRLWQVLPAQEQEELLTVEFRERTFARRLVMREFGFTSLDTLKKDRKKLRRTAK